MKDSFTGSLSITAGSAEEDHLGASTITWQTNDPLGAELRVFTATDGDKLVSRGGSGSLQVDWILPERHYTFSLSGLSQSDRRLASVDICVGKNLRQSRSDDEAKDQIELEEAVESI